MLLLELGAFLTFACAYVTQCLVLDASSGPWTGQDEMVYWQHGEDKWVRPVGFFDRLRRPFGVYKIEEEKWFVNPLRSGVFECPFCLSFWVSLVFTVPALLVFGYPLWLAPLMVFAVAGAAQVVMR